MLHSLAVADRSSRSVPLLAQLHLHPQIHAQHSHSNPHVCWHPCHIPEADFSTNNAHFSLWGSLLCSYYEYNLF